jgi:hypothetical protein
MSSISGHGCSVQSALPYADRSLRQNNAPGGVAEFKPHQLIFIQHTIIISSFDYLSDQLLVATNHVISSKSDNSSAVGLCRAESK